VDAMIPGIVITVPYCCLCSWRRVSSRRHLQRHGDPVGDLSPVIRQHIELFQGGQLSEARSKRSRFDFATFWRAANWRRRSQHAAGHSVCHPGPCLAEIGTDEAARILERQLGRRLAKDTMEQSWYWIDLANGCAT